MTASFNGYIIIVMKQKVERYQCRCEAVDKQGEVCDHVWVSRVATVPYQCPRCLSRHWDVSGDVTEEVEEKG